MQRTQNCQKTLLKKDKVGGFQLLDFKIITVSKRLWFWRKYRKTDQQNEV